MEGRALKLVHRAVLVLFTGATLPSRRRSGAQSNLCSQLRIE